MIRPSVSLRNLVNRFPELSIEDLTGGTDLRPMRTGAMGQ